ncbi:VTT domain-containing protein, partial [Candidatus Peregrinibacteria bacterium]|nr:VTT domain-containing protein [Candidatus Peregrinibacteria bacterium]
LGTLHPWVLALLLSSAAVIGDSVNYACGRCIGPKVFRSETHLFFKREYLDRTREFYRVHGAKTIVFARFVPIIRTFAPFVAGVGHMPYRQFFLYNVAGGILWVFLFVFGGVLFGNIPVVRENFTLVIFGIIGVSLLPGIVQWWRRYTA